MLASTKRAALAAAGASPSSAARPPRSRVFRARPTSTAWRRRTAGPRIRIARASTFSYEAPSEPGGVAQGRIFASLKVAQRSVSEEVDAFVALARFVERRAVTIDGLPCETAAIIVEGSPPVRGAMLLCHFIVLTTEGEASVEFSLGAASAESQAEPHSRVFWQVADSIRWNNTFKPAP